MAKNHLTKRVPLFEDHLSIEEIVVGRANFHKNRMYFILCAITSESPRKAEEIAVDFISGSEASFLQDVPN